MANKLENYLDNIIMKDKLSHAYIFHSNNEEELDNIILLFTKKIFCPNGINYCNSCKICNQINVKNYINFYCLETEGTIKKEDIENLKFNLSISPLLNKKVYWIKNIENITSQAANAVLKFLEEPPKDVLIFLTTTKIKSVISTIISRCQILNVGYFNNHELNTISNEEEFVKEVFEEFLKKYSPTEFFVIFYVMDKLRVKKDISVFFSMLLRYTYNNIKNNQYLNKLYELALKSKNELENNINARLVLDSFLFEMCKSNIEIR